MRKLRQHHRNDRCFASAGQFFKSIFILFREELHLGRKFAHVPLDLVSFACQKEQRNYFKGTQARVVVFFHQKHVQIGSRVHPSQISNSFSFSFSFFSTSIDFSSFCWFSLISLSSVLNSKFSPSSNFSIKEPARFDKERKTRRILSIG